MNEKNRRDEGPAEDTIAAIATPPGAGGIGIIRVSGPASGPILQAVFRRAGIQPDLPWESHRMYYGFLTSGTETLDEGMAVFMKGPRSYTREDVAEIQLHGGPWILQKALSLCLGTGARMAEPGEFTRRAFLAGRIDLTRAEAVMSMIAARGEQQHRAAVRQLQGGVTAFVREAADELYRIQAGLAACVDYPEEISEEEGAADMVPRIEKLIARLRSGIQERSSRLLQEGLRVTLAGRPNVGKSSLLNALLGEEKAIVTDIPGTTRDLVSGEMTLEGIRVLLTDTAGVRETEDAVERIGVERTRKAMAEADVFLLVVDGSESLTAEDRDLISGMPPGGAVLVNKNDLSRGVEEKEIRTLCGEREVIFCSARDPESLKPVKEYLKRFTALSDRMAVTQPRHLDALRRAVFYLEEALETVKTFSPDLAATDLQAAQSALGELTGDQVDEKLLDAVFSQFCVGK
ncbi:MAG: tRNA uridine-5-carboxymethylaminomethyl(34) synthesis GTPase MnmE [Clostridia bacterium]|nr:tRNA uridine-5-carboxymethylaminomethyl(34) synthesis GTPase MnmE [Clostridia bacterium]